MQLEQPHAIGDGRPALADLLRNVLLPQAEFLGEPGEGERFFNRVEVLALEVLDERQLQHLLVGRGPDDAGASERPTSLAARQRRSPAISSNFSRRCRTMSGWMMPCSRIESTSSRSFSPRNSVRGCSGVGTMSSSLICCTRSPSSGTGVGEATR